MTNFAHGLARLSMVISDTFSIRGRDCSVRFRWFRPKVLAKYTRCCV